MSPPGVANSCWWVSRYQQGCCYWWETDPAGGYPATSKAVATGGSHAPRGEWRPKGSWAACTIAGNTSGRLRRHSLGRADLLPVAAGLGDHPATTEAVATGGRHASRAVRRMETAGLLGGMHYRRQHLRAASPPFARQSRSPTSGCKPWRSSRYHRGCSFCWVSRYHRGCCDWWETRSAGGPTLRRISRPQHQPQTPFGENADNASGSQLTAWSTPLT